MRQFRQLASAEETVIAGAFPKGFTAYPVALMAGLTPEQVAWQQALYQRAYAEARAAAGFRVLRPTFGRVARN
jgi:hypothetical protein